MYIVLQYLSFSHVCKMTEFSRTWCYYLRTPNPFDSSVVDYIVGVVTTQVRNLESRGIVTEFTRTDFPGNSVFDLTFLSNDPYNVNRDVRVYATSRIIVKFNQLVSQPICIEYNFNMNQSFDRAVSSDVWNEIIGVFYEHPSYPIIYRAISYNDMDRVKNVDFACAGVIPAPPKQIRFAFHHMDMMYDFGDVVLTEDEIVQLHINKINRVHTALDTIGDPDLEPALRDVALLANQTQIHPLFIYTEPRLVSRLVAYIRDRDVALCDIEAENQRDVAEAIRVAQRAADDDILLAPERYAGMEYRYSGPALHRRIPLEYPDVVTLILKVLNNLATYCDCFEEIFMVQSHIQFLCENEGIVCNVVQGANLLK